jgi:hypothetical protein
MMNSAYKNNFLLSIAFSEAEKPDFLVSIQSKNSIENYENQKGGVK